MQVMAAIEYAYLYPDDETLRGMVTEIKNIMVDVMCGYRRVVISGRVIPDEVAKSVYSKLTSEHIRSVIYRILHYPRTNQENGSLHNSIPLQFDVYRKS